MFLYNIFFGKCKWICIFICWVFYIFFYKLYVLKLLNLKYKVFFKILFFVKFLKLCDRFYVVLIVYNNLG